MCLYVFVEVVVVLHELVVLDGEVGVGLDDHVE